MKYFTGEIKSVKANNENTLEVSKEKSETEKQESDEEPHTTANYFSSFNNRK